MGPRRPALRAAGARCERFDARSPRESRAQAPTEQTILRRTVLNGAPSIPVVQGPGEWEGVFFGSVLMFEGGKKLVLWCLKLYYPILLL